METLVRLATECAIIQLWTPKVMNLKAKSSQPTLQIRVQLFNSLFPQETLSKLTVRPQQKILQGVFPRKEPSPGKTFRRNQI